MSEKLIKQVPIGGVACRQSISLSDSLMESSNPDLLVDYIRAKRNLQRPRELFSNVFQSDKQRKSFNLQLEPYNTSETIEDKQQSHKSEPEIIEISSTDGILENNKRNNSPKKPRLPRVVLQNDSNQIQKHHNKARKVLLNEFELTINANEFEPPACSTPLSSDNEPSQNVICSNVNKHSRKKSLILQTIKPITPSELEAAKLIECLQREKLENEAKSKSNISLTEQNTSQNVTLRNNDKNTESFGNDEINLLSDEINLLLTPSLTGTLSQPQNDLGFENLENQNLRESNNKIISNTSMSVPQHSKEKSNSKNYQIPETEEFEIPTNSESLIIPETQDKIISKTSIPEPQHSKENSNSKNYQIPETEEFEIPTNSESLIIPETQDPETNLNDVGNQGLALDIPNDDSSVSAPKSPNRRTFTIHKFNNTVTTPPTPTHQFINKEYVTSPPISLRISNQTQMSPLARRAQVQLRAASVEKLRNKLPSRIPKFIQNDNNLPKNIVKSPIQSSHSPQHINEEIFNGIENFVQNGNRSIPMVVVPIYQTVNTSKDFPQTTISSPLSPPMEFCDKIVVITPTQQKDLTSNNSTTNHKNKTNIDITTDKENVLPERIPHPVLDNELLTEDEDICSSFNEIEKRKIIMQNKLPINLTKNKATLKNSIINETLEAMDLRTVRNSRKRKSSIIANNRINCHYEEVSLKEMKDQASHDCALKRIRRKYEQNVTDLINIDVNLTKENNNNFTTELLTKSLDKHNDKNGKRKSKRILKNKPTLTNEKGLNNLHPAKNNNRDERRNWFQLLENTDDIEFDTEINNETSTQKNITQSSSAKSFQSREKRTTTSTPNNVEKNISKSIINDARSSSGKNYKKKRISPILSRHITLSMLKENNFNKSNQLEYSAEEDNVDQQESHMSVNRKSRTRKRRTNNRKSSTNNRKSSSSITSSIPEKSTLINIDDMIVSNVAQEMIIDDPKAMTDFWKSSMQNKSKISGKKKEQNDSLKEFYLNVEKTFNLSSSSVSGRRKLYSKGQSENDNSPVCSTSSKCTPNKKTCSKNIDLQMHTNLNTQLLKTSKTKATNKNKQIIEDIQADWNQMDEFNDDDDRNPNITDQKQNENSISNNSNKKIKKKKKKSEVTDKNNKELNDHVFKMPTLPAPKSFGKKKQSKQQNNNVTSDNNNKKGKKSVDPKPTKQDNINVVQSERSTQFDTPQRTSTKKVNNIGKYFKNGKKNREVETVKSIEKQTEIENISVETTNTIRRSHRKPCPRVEYWTNERGNFSAEIVLIQPKKRSYNKSKKKSDINQPKDSNLREHSNNFATITEENEKQPEQPLNIDNQLSQIFDMLKESFSQNEKTNKLTTLNKKSNKNRKKSKKNNKMYEPIIDIVEEEINQSIITEQLPPEIQPETNEKQPETVVAGNEEVTSSNSGNSESSSKTVAVGNEEGISTNVNNQDSGNGTGINDPIKEVDAFSWLKKIINSNTSTSSSISSNMIIERLIMGKEFELSSFNYMQTVEKDGVEYYFCNSNIQNFGFIKLKPNLMKRPSKLKHFNINFILFCGELEFNVSERNFKNIKAGEVVIIKKNINYSIANKTNTDALLLFIKSKE